MEIYWRTFQPRGDENMNSDSASTAGAAATLEALPTTFTGDSFVFHSESCRSLLTGAHVSTAAFPPQNRVAHIIGDSKSMHFRTLSSPQPFSFLLLFPSSCSWKA